MSAFFHSSPDRVAHPSVRSVLAHLAMLAPTALLLGLAFPEPGWGILAHAALVPATLLAAWGWRARRLFWTSFVVSWGWWLVMIAWMAAVTGVGYVVLAAYLALYWPIYMLCWRRIHRTFQLPATLSVPLVWVSLEYVRGFFVAGGFPWFSIGYSQLPYAPTDSPPLLGQSASLFGEWTVSFLVAMTNGMLVDAISFLIAKKRAPATADRKRMLITVGTWASVFAMAFAYGIAQTNAPVNTSSSESSDASQPSSASDGPIFAVVQTNVSQDNKIRPTPESMKANWNRLESLTRQAAAHNPKPDVIVWPETMVQAPLNRQGVEEAKTRAERYKAVLDELKHLDGTDPAIAKRVADHYEQIAQGAGMTLQAYRTQVAVLAQHYEFASTSHTRVATLAKELGTYIIAGAAANEVSVTGNIQRFNCAYLYSPDGRQVQRYSKIHRVPFGEYIPWVEDWPWLKALFLKYLSPYESDYTLTPGNDYTVLEIAYTHPPKAPGTFRITTPICFEDAVARFCRRMVYDKSGKRCDAMINLTNDGWYPGTHQGPQHFQIAVMRCIENRVPMARAVNTGVSGFIRSDGRVGPLVEMDGMTQQVEGFAVLQMVQDDRKSLFASVGAMPVTLLMIATGILVLIGVLVRKKER